MSAAPAFARAASPERLPDTHAIPELLARYGELTRRAMLAYLPEGEPEPYLYGLLGDYPKRGGKMMRASLCLASARVFGAELEDAVSSAVAIELLHNSFLIHDDIQDESEERRGRPTLHKVHGVALALNAGESLSLLSVRPLRDNAARLGTRLSLRIFEETERMAWESAEGQALELGWRHENRMDIDEEDYLLMVLKKTCWLATIHPCRVGALIGARDTLDLDAFVRFGFFLGAAFQIQDDVLNLSAGEAYGKERNGDLFEGKRTLMTCHLHAHASEAERARLSRLFALPRAERSASEVEWLRGALDELGSLEYARAVARGLAGAALREFEIVFGERPESADKEFIHGLVRWVLEREA
jgi:geranylgeranyl diphosphate synthase type II